MKNIIVKSVFIGCLLTAAINYIYKISNLEMNIVINIILVVASFAILMKDSKSKEEQNEEFNNKTILLINDILENNKKNCIDMQEKIDLVIKSVQIVLEDNNKKIEEEISIIEENEALKIKLIKDLNIELKNNREQDDKQLEGIKEIIESIKDGISKQSEEYKTILKNDKNLNNITKINEKIEENEALKIKLIKDLNIELKNNREQDDKQLEEIKEIIESIKEDISNHPEIYKGILENNKSLNGMYKINMEIEKEIEELGDRVEEYIKEVVDELQENKIKNSRSLENLLETIEEQPIVYREIGEKFLSKMKEIEEQSERNIKLLEDSYNILDRVVDNIV